MLPTLSQLTHSVSFSVLEIKHILRCWFLFKMRKKFILHRDNIVQFCSGDHKESLPSSSYQSDPSHLVESSGSTEIIICLLTWTLSTTYIFFNLFISRIVDPPIWTVFGIETMFCTADKVLVLLHQLQDTLIAGLGIELEITADNFTDSLYQFPSSSKKDEMMKSMRRREVRYS